MVAHRNISAWQKIADDLAGAIGRGKYRTGSAIPSAMVLSETYGVNRHTVRQALLHLQSLGLVDVSPGRGTTVIETKLPYKIGKRVRFRANVSRAGLTGSTKILDATLETCGAEAGRELGLPVGSAVWRIETLSFAGKLPTSFATHVLAAARFPQFPDRLAVAKGSMTTAFRAYGIDDYERISTRITASRPSKQDHRHLALDRGEPVLCSLGLDGIEGVPFHRVESRFAASRIVFEVDGASD